MSRQKASSVGTNGAGPAGQGAGRRPRARPSPALKPIAVITLRLVRRQRLRAPATKLRDSTDAAGMAARYLAGQDREHFIAIMLDRSDVVIARRGRAAGQKR